MIDLANKLKGLLVDNLASNSYIADEPYLLSDNKVYTRKELVEEIENETEFGLKLLHQSLVLAIDLLARQKHKLE